ncbi:MAG: hypothetical protein ACX94B_11735 [Henriciella sp.]|nr:hypothetical protein [Hyphomonadaceae bacterium]
MKRAHKRAHLLIWIVLAPVIAGLFALSIVMRPGAPVNETLPDVLIEEAR